MEKKKIKTQLTSCLKKLKEVKKDVIALLENEIEVLTMNEVNAILNNQIEPEHSDIESSESEFSEDEYYDYFEYD